MPTTYTVKSGDTKSSLKAKYGIDLNDSQYRSTDPNKLFAGETLTIPTAPTAVVQNNQVDLSKVSEGVKTYNEPSTNLRDLSVAFSGKADDKTMQEIATRNPELADKAMDSQGYGYQLPNGGTFLDYSFDNLSPEEKLQRTATTISNEISAIEEKMANSDTERNGALDEAGVFEDLRKLNELKAELRAAEDKGIEIGIEGRQKLRGRAATKTEFDQLTRPALEKNVLEQLSASRATSRLTDTINTNIQVIDARLAAEAKRDEFLYTQKKARLEKVESIYGDIMTEKQKQAAADQKFKYDLILEGVKSDNSLRNDLIKDLAKKGITGNGLESVMNMSIDQLLSYSGNLTSPKRWSEMSFEEAATVLDKDSFDKFQAYREWEKGVSDEEKQSVTEALAVQDGAKGVIDTITDMLDDKQGLKTSVGVNSIGRSDFNIFGAGVESTKFRANARSLVSQNTLNTLKELKATGATLGAISEKELRILQDAQNKLGTVFDENGNATGKFNMKESDFMTALETMRLASMKTYVAASIGKQRYAAANLQNADFETVSKLYNDIIENGVEPVANFADQEVNGGNNNQNLNAAFEQIRQEEGLRLDAYQDTTGTWTIGFGNTQINGRPVQPGDRLNQEQAETLMQQSVIQNYTTFEDKVSANLSPNQFAALTSFEYNLGSGVWQTPTGTDIINRINRGDYAGAARLMQQYNKSRNAQTGALETNRVLAQRRAREANLLLS